MKKISRRHLRSIIQNLIHESMIKPEAMDPAIDDLIDMGNDENITMADELQSSLSGYDEPFYSDEIYHYEKPFMQNPDIREYVKSMMGNWLYQNKEEIVWGIENENSIDSVVDDYFYSDDFKRLAKNLSKGHQYSAGISHSFDGPPVRGGKLEKDLKNIFREVLEPFWKDWRDYFGLTL